MTLKFPDVSKYTPVDVSSYPIVLARATLSSSYIDPQYLNFKAQAQRSGAVFVAYHWLNHGNLRAQAAHCFSVVGPGIPVMIDAEDEAGNTGYAGPLTVDDILGFASRYRALGGIVSLAYLPFWYWSGAMGAPHRLGELASAGLGLVSSNYPSAGYTENGPGWAVYYPGAPAPVQWQYADTPIDMNAYKGTKEQYALMVGVPQVQDETITLGESMFLGKDGATGRVYLCDGFRSRHIENETDLNNVVALWQTGALSLLTGVGNTAALATDWEDYGGHAKLIRTGWYPGAYGVEGEPVTMTNDQITQLADAVSAEVEAGASVDDVKTLLNGTNVSVTISGSVTGTGSGGLAVAS